VRRPRRRAGRSPPWNAAESARRQFWRNTAALPENRSSSLASRVERLHQADPRDFSCSAAFIEASDSWTRRCAGGARPYSRERNTTRGDQQRHAGEHGADPEHEGDREQPRDDGPDEGEQPGPRKSTRRKGRSSSGTSRRPSASREETDRQADHVGEEAPPDILLHSRAAMNRERRARNRRRRAGSRRGP